MEDLALGPPRASGRENLKTDAGGAGKFLVSPGLDAALESETMADAAFVHLNVHSEYSLLNAACRTQELAEEAAALGMPAIALTDQGNLFGAIEFYKACRSAGVKPIAGSELFVAPADLGERKSAEADAYSSLIALATDATGYHSLMKLVSTAHLDGFHYKPRIDRKALEKDGDGLIFLSGGPRGEVAKALARNRAAEAVDSLAWYLERFGPDRFFIELTDHGLESEKHLNRALLRLARDQSARVVATNDVHYLKQEHAPAHDVLLCIQHGAHLEDPSRPRFPSPEYYLKSGAEMAALFSELPEALAATVEIAERCQLEIPLGINKFPKFFAPEGHTNISYFRELCLQGLRRRYGDRADDSEIRQRLEMEMEVITKTGFVDYFLIVWDFIRYAKEQGVPVGPGRGSAAGAMVAYVLEITDLDPLRYALFFERFLNPERVSPPDIDIDFCYNRRGEVIEYVRRKYGERSVAQIITFGTIGAKMAVRDVGRVLGLSYSESDRLAKMIPFDPKMTLKKALVENPEFKKAYDEEDTTRQVIDYGFTLEGMSRQAGVHAAGVVIADGDLTHTVPLTRDDSGGIVTQYSMDPLTEVGALKMDFLGLKTLTVIEDCLALIEKSTGRRIISDELPLDDPKAFELLQKAQNAGLFQVESGGMCDACRRVRPQAVEDLIALVALYRPGPMEFIPLYGDRKLGNTPVEYPHPLLEPILRETYGIIIYQEQVMQAAQVLAGYSLGAADVLRRAMGKKKPEEMAKQRAIFVKGCAEKNGIDAEKANLLFDLLDKFAGYGFNKAHAACYGVLAYRTAWLKANYPVEFMAALMSNDMDNTDKIAGFVTETRALGIAVLPPCVNASDDVFTVEETRKGESGAAFGGRIRFGLAAIKNVGWEAVRQMVQTRKEGGPFTSIADLCMRCGARSISRKLLENLIKAGGCDVFGRPRASLCHDIDLALAEAGAQARDRESGQASLFGAFESAPASSQATNGGLRAKNGASPESEWPLTERLGYEKDLLGFYFSGHPLDDFASEMQALQLATVAGLGTLAARESTRLAGMVTKVEVRTSKKDNRPWARFVMEDQTGATELLCFSDAYATLKNVPKERELVAVTGEVDRRDEQPKLMVREMKTLAEAREEFYRGVVVPVTLPAWSSGHWQQLRDVILDHPGKLRLFLRCEKSPGHSIIIETDTAYRVDFSRELESAVNRLLAPGHKMEIVATKQLPKRERKRWMEKS